MDCEVDAPAPHVIAEGQRDLRGEPELGGLGELPGQGVGRGRVPDSLAQGVQTRAQRAEHRFELLRGGAGLVVAQQRVVKVPSSR